MAAAKPLFILRPLVAFEPSFATILREGKGELGLAWARGNPDEGPMLYYEDIEVGSIQRFGSKLVTRDEVVDFAGKYDPQPFHLDDEAAAQTYFGRLSASGWHTGSMAMRMIVENMKANRQAGLGSPGIDELRWLKPVYPGDTLRCESELLEKRQSASKPEMGSFKSRLTVINQDDVAVMTMVSIGLIRVRGDAAA
jgi:acyl dehydratase